MENIFGFIFIGLLIYITISVLSGVIYAKYIEDVVELNIIGRVYFGISLIPLYGIFYIFGAIEFVLKLFPKLAILIFTKKEESPVYQEGDSLVNVLSELKIILKKHKLKFRMIKTCNNNEYRWNKSIGLEDGLMRRLNADFPDKIPTLLIYKCYETSINYKLRFRVE